MHVPLNLLKIIPQESHEERLCTYGSDENASKASNDAKSKKEFVIEKDIEEPSNNKSIEKGLDQDQMQKEWG